MFRKTLSASIVLAMSAFSFAANASCSAGDYCIDFEGNDLVAQDSAPGLSGSMWATVMDDEYTGANAFGGNNGVSVEFWTSVNDSGNADGTPDDFPTYNASNYNELNNGGDHSAPYLVLLDTNENTADDNDLEVGTGMNGSYTGGNIAIIHEESDNDRDCEDTNSDGVADYCENADDRYKSGEPHGGFVFVHFSEPVHVHSIDLVDMESSDSQRGSFGFYDDASNLLSNGMVAMTYDSGVNEMDNGSFGTQTFSNDLQSLSITTLVIRMQGSGGFDNIAFSKATEVSEPGTLAMFAVGLLGLARLRKAKR